MCLGKLLEQQFKSIVSISLVVDVDEARLVAFPGSHGSLSLTNIVRSGLLVTSAQGTWVVAGRNRELAGLERESSIWARSAITHVVVVGFIISSRTLILSLISVEHLEFGLLLRF